MTPQIQRNQRDNLPFAAFKKCRKWLRKVMFGAFYIAIIGFKILFSSKDRQKAGFSATDSIGRWIGFLAICSFPILALGAIIAFPLLLVALVLTGALAALNGAFNAVANAFSEKRLNIPNSKKNASTHTQLVKTRAPLHKNDNSYQKSAVKPPVVNPIKYLNGERKVTDLKPGGQDTPPSLKLV